MLLCAHMCYHPVNESKQIFENMLEYMEKVIRELPFPKRENPNQVWSKVLCVRENLKLLLKTFRVKI